MIVTRSNKNDQLWWYFLSKGAEMNAVAYTKNNAYQVCIYS
jgi:hypothetical protein